MRACEIAGVGTALPAGVVTFGDQTRYRVERSGELLDLLEAAAREALDDAGLGPEQLDLVICANAAGAQPLPCTAALLMERIAVQGTAAAFDVNSTCTSFITALDVASRYVAAGDASHVLIVAGDVGSRFLDPAQRESYELFSDAGAAVVLRAAPGRDAGVVASAQRTWPAYAHTTEVRGGLASVPPQEFGSRDPRDYLFDMDGRAALLAMARVLPGFFREFFEASGLPADAFALVVPHQASRALGLVMSRIGIASGAYADEVQRLGNMVSASVPYVLIERMRTGQVGRGDTVLLCGTAAGLTANALALRL